MIQYVQAIEPGPGGGHFSVTQGATLGYGGFCAIILIWCSILWGWWRVAIIAMASAAFGVIGTLSVQGFNILSAFGGLIDSARASLG